MLKDMSKKKMRGFTLIELVAVLVIMAILALIVTPLVMNIVRKARIAADKRSIDAYGRSIELAIAGYLLDTGTFPTEVSQLTIEYSGDTVSCTTEQINPDSSIYLAGCTVKNRTVEGYTYGTDKNTTPEPVALTYTVGNHVSYNNASYYVIEDSGTSSDTVKLLKETPLTKSEIEGYNISGLTVGGSTYGEVQYGSSVDYSTSTVKQVVDKWAESAVKAGDTATTRLITYDELIDNLGYDPTISSAGNPQKNDNVPMWVYNSNYSYWTKSTKNSSNVWGVRLDGELHDFGLSGSFMVRPVLEISKSADITKLES